MIDGKFDFERTASVPSVTELLKQFPNLPARVVVTLAVIALLSRSVTPFRTCECGCGEPVHGKAKSAGEACRKRLEREREALRAGSAPNLNLVLQYEIPVPIPTVTVRAKINSENPPELKLEIIGNDFPFEHRVNGEPLPELPAPDATIPLFRE